MATVATPMTTEELLALPENGHDRWLIQGELRERPMPTRNRFHSYTMTRCARFLDTWLDMQPAPRGRILTGDAGVRLRRNPDTTFGIDVVYVSAEVLARQTANSTIIDGLPTLAVEILSPSDTIEDINDKIDALLEAGVPLVWIMDPFRRTVMAHSPGAEPMLFNSQQELTGEPHLPGFRVPVRSLFE
jgi:Uma2 family endonuclease